MGKNNYITITESPNSGASHSLSSVLPLLKPTIAFTQEGLGRLCCGRKGQGRDRALPVRSEGTRYFLLSRSGTLALGAFSTITWEERQRVGMKTAESNQYVSFYTLQLPLSEVSFSRLNITFPSLILSYPLQNVQGNKLS